ncbi:MAG: hypothetical protein JXA90_01985 [Planctomycetes bacterium]|nr:hypothetical protein [Planctomycetota bacterium]
MFWLRCFRLAASVAAEMAAGAVHLVIFLFRRRKVREEIRGLMERPAARAVSCAAATLVWAFLTATGCESFPGNSFGKQVEEVQWSAITLVEQPHWAEDLLWDLELLADPELDQIEDTLTLLGW